MTALCILHSTEQPAAPGSIPSIPEIFSEVKLSMLLRSIQRRRLELEDSGQCLENVDRTTHLVWLVASQYYKKVISAFRRGWFRLPVAGLPLRFALPRRGDQTRQLPHLSHPAQVDRCQDRQVDWNQRLQIGNERHYCASVTSSCAEL